MKKSTLIGIVIAAVIALGAIGAYVLSQQNDQETTQQTPTTSESTQATTDTEDTSITYPGEEGKTALELLQTYADVEMQGEGEMAFVTSINGIEAESNVNFWSFLVNGEMAAVGAGTYETKSTDTITWELTDIDSSFSEETAE